MSRETLRKWMVKASFWRPRAQRIKTIPCGASAAPVSESWRCKIAPRFVGPRSVGLLCQLIAVIDDATSRF